MMRAGAAEALSCLALPCLALQTLNEKGRRRPPVRARHGGMAEQDNTSKACRTCSHESPLATHRPPFASLAQGFASETRTSDEPAWMQHPLTRTQVQVQRSAALRGDARTGAHPTAASSGAVWLGPSRYVALPSSSLSASQHGRAAAHRGPDAALLPPPPLPFWHTSRRFWIASGAGTYSVPAEPLSALLGCSTAIAVSS
ncbi:hypothetical protein Q7P35_001659 [Cladosporium inversicolor]